jgi:hypothetical protein
MMTKTAKTMRWTTVALLAGALALPGMALARGDDGHRGDWDHHGDWDRRGGWDDRRHEKGHWRHRPHGQWGRDRRVVVVREPVYVRPRPLAPPPPSPWVPLAVGIAGLLHGY